LAVKFVKFSPLAVLNAQPKVGGEGGGAAELKRTEI
jgi:hypothetical protein